MALRRGYVVGLYPGVDSHHRETDYPGYESVWKSFRSEYPEATWTEISTKAWLASRTLDYLLAPESGYPISPAHVGIIGFSRYGKQSLIAAAFDRRITSVVARSPGSPGSCPYRFTSRDTFAEAPADFPSEWFLPQLRKYTGREHELPMDAHGWYALIAPCRCLVHTAHNDGSEPTFAVERAYLEGKKVYRLLGHPENLRVLYRRGQHGPITDAQRSINLDWFDLSFGRGHVLAESFPEELLHHFDWNRWRSKLEPQAVQPPLVGHAHDSTELKTAIEWLLGTAPRELKATSHNEFLSAEESKMMTHDRWAVAGIERVPIRFGAGVRGNAYFRSGLSAAAPVVVWLHPYSYHSGYNEGYGVQGTTVYHRLAQAGFVVIAYDQCGFGLRLLEGRDFYDHHPTWSRLGRMIHDARAAVDFVGAKQGRSQRPLPAIDSKRVALLGYSIGGLVALHAAALDDRITAVAAFSGFQPFRAPGKEIATGGNRRLWQWHALVPKLGLFEGREDEIPYDVDDLLVNIAPRARLIVAPKRDRTANLTDIEKVIERVEEQGSASSLTFRAPDDRLRFQKDQHETFIRWLNALWSGSRRGQ